MQCSLPLCNTGSSVRFIYHSVFCVKAETHFWYVAILVFVVCPILFSSLLYHYHQVPNRLCIPPSPPHPFSLFCNKNNLNNNLFRNRRGTSESSKSSWILFLSDFVTMIRPILYRFPFPSCNRVRI